MTLPGTAIQTHGAFLNFNHYLQWVSPLSQFNQQVYSSLRQIKQSSPLPQTPQVERADSFKWSTETNLTRKCFSWTSGNKTQMQSYLTQPILHIYSQLCNKPQDAFTGFNQAKLPADFHEGALINQKLQELDPVFSLLMKRFILSCENLRLYELGKSITLALMA